MVLALAHALRMHEALSRPDALPSLLEVVHRLFKYGVFVGHDLSIRAGILRSPDCFAFSREHVAWELLRKRGRMKESSKRFTVRHLLSSRHSCLGTRHLSCSPSTNNVRLRYCASNRGWLPQSNIVESIKRRGAGAGRTFGD
jgi:hypothetical protein